jgi:4-hydroxy-2-oxoheptanedioate aldolase
MKKSRVLERLRANEVVKLATISRFPQPWVAELVGTLGYDAIWFDIEHRGFSYDTIEQMSLPCRGTGIDLMVRILKSGYHSPMRALEMGAAGIMVPHVLSAEEARQWVEWVRFPPGGKRGFDGAGADADYLLADSLEYIEHANSQTFLALQIEDKEAVDNIDEIAAVEGFDILFVGPGDLSLSYGVPFQREHRLIETAIDRVANAAAKHGKWWGIPTGELADAQRIVDRGARIVTCGNDLVYIVEGFKATFEEFRPLKVKRA